MRHWVVIGCGLVVVGWCLLLFAGTAGCWVVGVLVRVASDFLGNEFWGSGAALGVILGCLGVLLAPVGRTWVNLWPSWGALGSS